MSRSITGLISYLFISLPEKKLLLLESVFTEPVHKFVFKHPQIILVSLVLLYVVIEVIIGQRNNNKVINHQCYNICRYIYKHIEKTISPAFAHSLRITVFKAIKPNTAEVYLEAVSRYQVKEPLKKTKIRFKPGEGVAGSCFQTQSLVFGSLPECNETNLNEYYKKSWEEYKMERSVVDKLNIKSCLFLGIPIKYFDTERSWGVLLLDSTEKDMQSNMQKARDIEEIIEHYTVFFTGKEKQ